MAGSGAILCGCRLEVCDWVAPTQKVVNRRVLVDYVCQNG